MWLIRHAVTYTHTWCLQQIEVVIVRRTTTGSDLKIQAKMKRGLGSLALRNAKIRNYGHRNNEWMLFFANFEQISLIAAVVLVLSAHHHHLPLFDVAYACMVLIIIVMTCIQRAACTLYFFSLFVQCRIQFILSTFSTFFVLFFVYKMNCKCAIALIVVIRPNAFSIKW